MKLTDRLMTIAELCKGSDAVIDVGCDHAKLPIYLIENNIVNRAIATDIRQGPVDNARKNVAANKLEDKIRINLCNGLEDFGPEDGDTIIVAGMGAEEIVSIIDNAPWTKNENIKLILQPMTLEYKLREYLYKNGYEVRNEEIAIEGPKVYTIICASWTGKELKEENYNLFSDKLYYGRNRCTYIEKLIKRYSRMQEGHKMSAGGEVEELNTILEMLHNTLEKMKKEL
ncbi:MAG: SAM-dependent methyltransferase [Clostridia bacterium]|nr:SAM-dependent methyltransferase [Clostridia bacterium]MBQ7093397.1 SAM-dependent methyltransferase [Clostridia bacterium]